MEDSSVLNELMTDDEADMTGGVAIGQSVMNMTEDVTRLDQTELDETKSVEKSTVEEKTTTTPSTKETTKSEENPPNLESTGNHGQIMPDLSVSAVSMDESALEEKTETTAKSTVIEKTQIIISDDESEKADNSDLVCLGDKDETVLSGDPDDTDEFDTAEMEVSESVQTVSDEKESVSPSRSVSPPPKLPTPKFTKTRSETVLNVSSGSLPVVSDEDQIDEDEESLHEPFKSSAFVSAEIKVKSCFFFCGMVVK